MDHINDKQGYFPMTHWRKDPTGGEYELPSDKSWWFLVFAGASALVFGAAVLMMLFR